ncbi:SCO2523 family variant P-loop protein [Actinocorallia sp. B10E7]|uniref:SCO2523 family variant P-loop protein n=1 Tax=Actinocorallia sp. B10E7 TaxID=3153558 RepID=UPI00325DDECC
MLIIATSDKGGTGRSVTTCNVAYRRALRGSDVCYLDFDFGSPTSGAIFNVENVTHGTADGGLHSYLQGVRAEPHRVDVWTESERSGQLSRPPGAGRLVLLPGDLSGGEFSMNAEVVERCVKLLIRLQEEFDLVLMDLSAGRSHAAEMVLTATALPQIKEMGVRWLVYHRWTRQHVSSAASLVYGRRGLLAAGAERGHDRDELLDRIRFVRTAFVDPSGPGVAALRSTQETWLRRINEDLKERARLAGLGRSMAIATVPLDPVLQWREQLISDEDVWNGIANQQTVDAFEELAEAVLGEKAWARL